MFNILREYSLNVVYFRNNVNNLNTQIKTINKTKMYQPQVSNCRIVGAYSILSIL